MNTRLFLILALVATLFTTAAKANNAEKIYDLDGTSVKISAVSKTILVNLGSVKNEEVIIKIEDAQGNILVSETVKEKAVFSRTYNVSQLENGAFTLFIVKKMTKTIQPFNVFNGQVTMLAAEMKEKFLPLLIQKNDKLDVNVLLGNYSNITVIVYDNEGHKVFEDKNYVVFDLHKRYDLSKLNKGSYLAEVTAGDEVAYYNIVR